MLKTILLPLDGSPLAERALPYASAIARRSGARVALVEAVQAHALPGADLSDAQIAVTGHADDNLRVAASRLGAMGVAAEAHVYYDDPVHAILDAAERHQADLIVMSTHGRSGLGRMVYGSVTDQVLRRATIPVLVVPSIVDRPWSTDRPLSLLVPLDGSELAEDALRSAELLGEAFDARLTLLSVVEPPGYPLYGDGYAYMPFDEDAELANARQYLLEHQDRLRQNGRQVEARVAVGHPAGLIPVIAREEQADVVVMATHGHGGLTRLILGSVATSALRQATVPLLLVRPSALHQPEQEDGAPTATERPVSEAIRLAAPSDESSGPVVEVRLNATDLELIERGLKALAYAPGYDYGHVLAAQALAQRLEASASADVGESVAVR